MSLLLNRTEFGKPTDAGNVLSREAATQLFNDWVKNERLHTPPHPVVPRRSAGAAQRPT